MATSRRRVRRRDKKSHGKTRMRCQQCHCVGARGQRAAAPGGKYRAAYRHAGPFGLWVGTGLCKNATACSRRERRLQGRRDYARMVRP